MTSRRAAAGSEESRELSRRRRRAHVRAPAGLCTDHHRKVGALDLSSVFFLPSQKRPSCPVKRRASLGLLSALGAIGSVVRVVSVSGFLPFLLQGSDVKKDSISILLERAGPAVVIYLSSFQSPLPCCCYRLYNAVAGMDYKGHLVASLSAPQHLISGQRRQDL